MTEPLAPQTPPRRKRRLHVKELPILHGWPETSFVEVVWEDDEYHWWVREDNGDLVIGKYADTWSRSMNAYYPKPYAIKVIKDPYYLEVWEETYEDEPDLPVAEEPVDVFASDADEGDDEANALVDPDQPPLFDLPADTSASDAVEPVGRKSLSVPPSFLEKQSFLDEGKVKIRLNTALHPEPHLAPQPLARLDDETRLDIKLDLGPKTLPQSSLDPNTGRLTQIVADYSVTESPES